MALYRIENLKQGVVLLPQPVGIRLAARQTIVYSGPAGMNEANGYRRYGQLFRMIETGLIRVTTVEDPARDDNVEVATVSMLGSVTSAGQYRAVADIPARDAIPAGERVEGMLVRTNDTGQFWTLGPDLMTWTLVNFSVVPATEVGQVLWSIDGLTFTPQLPLTSVSPDRGGWLVNDLGYMLVVG